MTIITQTIRPHYAVMAVLSIPLAWAGFLRSDMCKFHCLLLIGAHACTVAALAYQGKRP